MNKAHLDKVLQTATPTEEDGWLKFQAERLVTVYAAHDGVSLNVPRVEALRVDGEMVRARTNKGDVYWLALEDIFALAMDAAPSNTRKAGFGSNQ